MRRFQRTIKNPVSFAGVGLHTGKEVSLRFCPSPPDSGIVFQRVDLPGKPLIPATVEYVQETSRSTTIGIGSCSVQTIEHVMAAVFSFSIDNLCIQVTAGEPPISDGSSLTFVEMIENAGIEEQSVFAKEISLKEPVFYTKGPIHLVAMPADEYRISYVLHYPQTPVIRTQYFSMEVTQESFKKEMAGSRTFALYDEINLLMQKGLIKGGSLENAVVIKDDVIFSKEGLRYSDEMVRHKTLDLIGDLALVGFHFKAHVIAIRSGHASNVELARLIVDSTYAEKRLNPQEALL
jgi:UDP-3-O-[3-hydroxymyristoyl] N-acetylglucosamine deacetylase